MKLLISTFIVFLIYCILLLGAENQVEVGALVAVAFVASLVGKKLGFMDRLAIAVSQHSSNCFCSWCLDHDGGVS